MDIWDPLSSPDAYSVNLFSVVISFLIVIRVGYEVESLFKWRICSLSEFISTNFSFALVKFKFWFSLIPRVWSSWNTSYSCYCLKLYSFVRISYWVKVGILSILSNLFIDDLREATLLSSFEIDWLLFVLLPSPKKLPKAFFSPLKTKFYELRIPWLYELLDDVENGAEFLWPSKAFAKPQALPPLWLDALALYTVLASKDIRFKFEF